MRRRIAASLAGVAVAAPGNSPFLSNFDGTNPNGTWKLFVVDDSQSASGSLSSWSLRIRSRVSR